jgi:hypothetical protein
MKINLFKLKQIIRNKMITNISNENLNAVSGGTTYCAAYADTRIGNFVKTTCIFFGNPVDATNQSTCLGVALNDENISANANKFSYGTIEVASYRPEAINSIQGQGSYNKLGDCDNSTFFGRLLSYIRN